MDMMQMMFGKALVQSGLSLCSLLSSGQDRARGAHRLRRRMRGPWSPAELSDDRVHGDQPAQSACLPSLPLDTQVPSTTKERGRFIVLQARYFDLGKVLRGRVKYGLLAGRSQG